MPPQENYDSYRELVRKAIQEKTGKTILNSSLDHASIIIEAAFNNAKRIRILSSGLDPVCYSARDGLRDAVDFFFLDKSHKAEILVESDRNIDWTDHPLFKHLDPDIKKNQLHIKRVKPEWIPSYKYNFLLLDDFGYRFEPDRNGPAAMAAFFKETDEGIESVKRLGGIFDTLWANSIELANHTQLSTA